MNGKRIVYGIGMVLAVLAVLTAHAAAENRAYFVPQHSNATAGDTTWVTVYLDLEEGETLAGGGLQIRFDPAHADITACSKGCGSPAEGKHCWGTLDKNFDYTEDGYMWGGVCDPQIAVYDDDEGSWIWQSTETGAFEGPMTVKICRYKVEAQETSGVSPFDFGFELYPGGCPLCMPCVFGNITTAPLDITWENGTFTCMGGTETFEKELVSGWNLISLPLTPVDNHTSAVLSTMAGKYSTVFRYNAETKEFEALNVGAMDDPMDPGIGYFVNVTAEEGGTWSYGGTPYGYGYTTPMEINLKKGLNLVGWLECQKDVSDGLSSIEGKYNYVAQWNAGGYELYDANAPPDDPMFFDFGTMDRGNGYWISAKEDCTLEEICS